MVMGRSRTSILLVAASAALVGAACGQTVKPITPSSSFSPLPTPSIPTSLPPQLQQSFCQHLGDLDQTLSNIQASPSQTASQVKASLSNVGSELQADQQQLQSAGQAALASVVQSVVTAVDTLDQSIPQNGPLPSGIATGLAIVTGAIQQIPPTVCPSPSA